MRNTMLSRGLGLVISVVLAITGLTLAASPAYADPPPPVAVDRSGSDQDEFEIPDTSGAYDYYIDGDGNVATESDLSGVEVGHNSTGEKGSVLIRAIDPWAGEEFVGTWTLTYNLAVTGAEAGESYRAEVVPNTCNKTTKQWQVNWFALNLPDTTGRFVPSIDGSVSRLDDDTIIPPGAQDVFLYTERLHDGVEASLGIVSLYPGTYKFAADTPTQQGGWQSWRLKVPTCGNILGPEAQPGTGSVLPKGKLKKVRNKTFVKGKAINKKVTAKTKFVLIKNPRIGKTVRQTITVEAGKVFKIKPFKAKPGTMVTLYAVVKGKLKKLARVFVQRPLSRPKMHVIS